MAGNENSGRKPIFHLTERKLSDRIREYKAFIKESDYRPSVSHFAAFIETTERDMAAFVEAYKDAPNSAYYARARALEGVFTWIRGETLSSPKWGGQGAGLAKVALEADYGDGYTYRAAKDGPSGPSKLQVSFGDGDPRGKLAGK